MESLEEASVVGLLSLGVPTIWNKHNKVDNSMNYCGKMVSVSSKFRMVWLGANKLFKRCIFSEADFASSFVKGWQRTLAWNHMSRKVKANRLGRLWQSYPHEREIVLFWFWSRLIEQLAELGKNGLHRLNFSDFTKCVCMLAYPDNLGI